MNEQSNIGWYFPKSDGGLFNGADGNSSASDFKGAPLASLAKEVLQNSLDARVNSKLPAKVSFSVFTLPIEDLPGANDLKTVVYESREYSVVDDTKNAKIKAFFDGAAKAASSKSVVCMRISDFNTTGLTNPDANMKNPRERSQSRWLNLVHGMGGTDKGGSSGGSHGKGKSAALGNSALRTLFYSTITNDGKQAFQGVAFLTTHIDTDGDLAQGVGFYGNKDELKTPIMKCLSLDPNFKRDAMGTDIFVIGFENRSDWKEAILATVFNDYLVALWHDDLIVDIDGLVIDKNSMESLIDEYKEACTTIEESNNYAGWSLEALNNPDYQTTEEPVSLDGIKGEVDIFLKTGSGYPKSVALVRETGMKVYDRRNTNSALQYVGIMYIRGDELNSFLAGLENVQHTNWEPQRDETVDDGGKTAKKRLNKLYAVLRDHITELIAHSEKERVEVDGLENYFGLDLTDDEGAGNQSEEDKNTAASVTVSTYKAAGQAGLYNVSSREGAMGLFDLGLGNDEEEKDSPASPTPPGPEPPNPPDPEDKDGNTGDEPGGPQSGDEKNKRVKKKPIGIKQEALLAERGTGKYSLFLEPEKSADVTITLCYSGEDSDEKPTIGKVEAFEGGIEIDFEKNIIGPVRLAKGKLTKITFWTDEKDTYALGVDVDAN